METRTPENVKRNMVGWPQNVYLSIREPDDTVDPAFPLLARLCSSPDDMYVLSSALIDEIGGENGLGLTAWFRSEDIERVAQHYYNLGYEVKIADEASHSAE